MLQAKPYLSPPLFSVHTSKTPCPDSHKAMALFSRLLARSSSLARARVLFLLFLSALPLSLLPPLSLSPYPPSLPSALDGQGPSQFEPAGSQESLQARQRPLPLPLAQPLPPRPASPLPHRRNLIAIYWRTMVSPRARRRLAVMVALERSGVSKWGFRRLVM